jgi:Ice-binding-like
MSSPIHLKPARRVGIAVLALFAFLLIPAAAQAAPVNLATVGPFVALGGSTVTNSGPSVLNGALGVAPGTSLTGFGLPAVVNGPTHDNNAVANQAQADLTIAYNAAAGQPVSPEDDLSGTDLGNRTLAAGAYRYTSSAQLTGPLVLDAEGDPDAQFVFEIAAELTTAPASSVVLVNEASPCNVFWQVGSSATLDTTTAFQGNLMALTSISLNNGASVIGRVLARNGQISLINNVLDGSQCGADTALPPPGETPSGETSSGDTPSGGAQGGDQPAAAGQAASQGRTGTRVPRSARSNGRATVRRTPNRTLSPACAAGFHATVRGRLIKRVVFSLDGRRIDSQVRSPFRLSVWAAPGRHTVRVRVTFRDATRAKTMVVPYRACASAVLRPRRGPSQFTG